MYESTRMWPVRSWARPISSIESCWLEDNVLCRTSAQTTRAPKRRAFKRPWNMTNTSQHIDHLFTFFCEIYWSTWKNMKKHRRLRCYQMKCWNAWCWDKMLKCLMLRRLRSTARLRSQTTKLASYLIADIKMTLNGHMIPLTSKKKPFVAISLRPGRRGGRWFVYFSRWNGLRP